MISNKFIGIGRLTKDPELKTINGKSCVNFSLAINKWSKDKDHPMADFIDFVAWNSTADLIAKYFSKGSKIGVEGKIDTRSYEDKEGKKHKIFEILVESIEFIESKNNKNNDDVQNSKNDLSNDTENASLDEGNEEDLPF